MSERELIKSRLKEKHNKQLAQRQATQLSLGVIILIICSFWLFWLINRLPNPQSSEIFYWNSIPLILSSSLLEFGKRKVNNHEIERAFQSWGFGLILNITFMALQLIGLEELVSSGLHQRNIYFPLFTFHLLLTATSAWYNYKIFKGLKNYSIHSKADHHLNLSVWLVYSSTALYLLILIF